MVRERLSDKISGSLVGIWLLVPEHLRLGTWDLLCSWTAQPPERLEPRLALQLVHEAALCVTGMRERRTLSQKGFELANGLPFIASDAAMHDLLEAHSVAEAQQLQVALGMIRRARGHFQGKRVAIDPHLMPSYSKRQMRRHRGHHHEEQKALKKAQTFFALDVDTHQPICLLTGTASRTVTQATPLLLELVERILNPKQTQPLVLADSEHFTHRLIEQIGQRGAFRLLVPMPEQPYYRKKVAALPPEAFVRRWAGLATAKVPFDNKQGDWGRVYQLVQRLGERPEQYEYKSFLSTTDADEVVAFMDDFPDRWHVEEFFHNHQALGWKRAGTLNLHIRYAQMTMALIAQAALHQLRQRLGEPYQSWEADHFATHLLRGLDGDIRVHDDTILVTYYNADNVALLRRHYEDLPAKLQEQGINPAIPWLYDFKLDFRFK